MILAQEITNFLIENCNSAKKHTSSPVMLISTDKLLKLKDGKLANITPKILDYMVIKNQNQSLKNH